MDLLIRLKVQNKTEVQRRQTGLKIVIRYMMASPYLQTWHPWIWTQSLQLEGIGDIPDVTGIALQLHLDAHNLPTPQNASHSECQFVKVGAPYPFRFHYP